MPNLQSNSPRSQVQPLLNISPAIFRLKRSLLSGDRTMPLFDQNRWYQINNGVFRGQSLVGTPVFNPDHTGTTFMRITNTSDPEQKWQIFPADNDTYVLRTQGSGQHVYLRANEWPEEDTLGQTAAGTIDVDYADEAVFWRILPYDNGGFYLENVANGTAWHLYVKTTSFLAMTSNIAGKQVNQVFNFTQQGEINNTRFSTLKVSLVHRVGWYISDRILATRITCDSNRFLSSSKFLHFNQHHTNNLIDVRHIHITCSRILK